MIHFTTQMTRNGCRHLVLVCLLFLAAGCEMNNMDDPSAGGSPSPAPSSGGSPQGNDDSSSGDDTGGGTTPTPPPPEPEPSVGQFMWKPGSDSVEVTIPAKYPHWRFWVFSRRKHVVLYGPDDRSGNKSRDFVYRLSGNGEYWRQKSKDAGDDGTLLVIVNTKNIETPPNRNAAWRIMNPSGYQSGDGDRLVPGGPDR